MNMFSRSLLYVVCIGFLSGVLLCSLLPIPTALYSFFILLIIVSILLSFLLFSVRLWVLTAFLCACMLGMARFEFFDASIEKATIPETYTGQTIVFQGTIVDEPDLRDGHTKLTVRVSKINNEELSGKILLTAKRYPELFYGDVIEGRGVLNHPKSFETDFGRMFDYPLYLRREKITHVMFYPEVSFLRSGEGNAIREFFLSLKQRYVQSLEVLLPEPHISLLSGLLLGARQAMGEELLEVFQITGIIHIIVLSGYNITIIAETLMRLSMFLPRVAGVGLGILGIIIFLFIVGASPTVLRASIMAILVIVAKFFNRPHLAVRGLFIAAFCMVLLNPYILVYDPSFQLSCLATLGLIFMTPRVSLLLTFISERFGFRELVATTLGTQLFVLPFLLYQIGQLSFIALPVNILVLPLIPLTMLIGFLAGVFALISSLLSLPFVYLVYVLLSYIFLVAQWAAQIPGAAIMVPPFPFAVVIIVYIGIGWYIYRTRKLYPSYEQSAV